jgi:hypothetical protein
MNLAKPLGSQINNFFTHIMQAVIKGEIKGARLFLDRL